MSNYNPNHVFVKNFFLIGVKLILENSNGEILLLRRSEKVSRVHGWDLPGGAVDAHEAPSDAIIRELQEETGIVIDSAQLYSSHLNTNHKDDAIILGFYATTKQNDVALSWEHDEFRWMTPEKAHELGLPRIYTEMIETYLKSSDHLNLNS